MSGIDRYSMYAEGPGHDPEGRWVLYSDHAEALAKREAVAVPVAVPSAHEMLLAIAADAYRSWNEDRDMRVGKILHALSSPAFAIDYRKDIAELHDLLAASQQAAKEEGR